MCWIGRWVSLDGLAGGWLLVTRGRQDKYGTRPVHAVAYLVKNILWEDSVVIWLCLYVCRCGYIGICLLKHWQIAAFRVLHGVCLVLVIRHVYVLVMQLVARLLERICIDNLPRLEEIFNIYLE